MDFVAAKEQKMEMRRRTKYLRGFKLKYLTGDDDLRILAISP